MNIAGKLFGGIGQPARITPARTGETTSARDRTPYSQRLAQSHERRRRAEGA